MDIMDTKQINAFLDDAESAQSFVLHKAARELAKHHRNTVIPALKDKGYATGQNLGQEESEEAILGLMRKGFILVGMDDMTLTFYMMNPLRGGYAQMPLVLELESQDDGLRPDAPV